MTSIWILKIEHQYGQNLYACSSEAIAKAWLCQYVKENWNEEVLGDFKALSDQQAIERYWEYFNEEASTEFYELSEEALLSAIPEQPRNNPSKE